MKTKLHPLAAGIFLASITAGLGQPVITNQPHAQATALGTTATFTVGARGADPLAYQWQREQGTGFFDLADGANVVLTLTDAQLSDRANYRVIVSDAGGSVTSAVAPWYVMSFAALSDRILLDDFNDNQLTDWTTYGRYGSGVLIESNQQLTVYGFWPGKRTTSTDINYCVGGLPLSSGRTVPEGQTLEWRVDLNHLDDNATNAVKFAVVTPTGVYSFFKWRDFILLNKAVAELWTYRMPIVHYVDASSASPAPPYTNWATAARVIQDAVDAVAPGRRVCGHERPLRHRRAGAG